MKINKNITPYNKWEGRAGYSVEWIVLHYTANTYQPDLAKNECAAFASKYIGASAHFFVDETEIWQSVEIEDTAWHCGDNPPSKNGCTNRNSIGIEMCVVYKNGVYSIADKTVDNALWLVTYLLEQFPTAKICRHYDVTGKRCPMPWVDDPSLWEDFLKRVEENRPMTPAEKTAFANLQKTVDAQAKEIAALKKKTQIIVDGEVAQNKDIQKIDDRTAQKYNTIKQCPDWSRDTIKKLVDDGYLKGDGDGLALTEDDVRILVILDRAGGFDK